MPDGPLHNLRRDIIWGPTQSPFLLIAKLELGGQPEVADLEIHVLVEEDVAHLEVPVDDPIAVHVLEGRDDLEHEVPGLLDGELLPLLDHLAECFVNAELQDDVDVLGVLEDAVELDYVLVVQGFMNLDFGKQLSRLAGTFCLALFFCRVPLSITFMAYICLVYKFMPS